jgi:hypothetical protein
MSTQTDTSFHPLNPNGSPLSGDGLARVENSWLEKL